MTIDRQAELPGRRSLSLETFGCHSTVAQLGLEGSDSLEVGDGQQIFFLYQQLDVFPVLELLDLPVLAR